MADTARASSPGRPETVVVIGKSAAVIGGGLLGLEAAKAAHDLGVETHVIEFMPRLMPRQVDDAGSRLLVEEIEKLGVRVRIGAATRAILGNGRVQGMAFDGGDERLLGGVLVGDASDYGNLMMLAKNREPERRAAAGSESPRPRREPLRSPTVLLTSREAAGYCSSRWLQLEDRRTFGARSTS